MIIDLLPTITHTIDGYCVKQLKYNKRDNILVGLVKCPIIGNDKFNDGFICAQWRTNGSPTNTFRNRRDLFLKINE